LPRVNASTFRANGNANALQVCDVDILEATASELGEYFGFHAGKCIPSSKVS